MVLSCAHETILLVVSVAYSNVIKYCRLHCEILESWSPSSTALYYLKFRIPFRIRLQPPWQPFSQRKNLPSDNLPRHGSRSRPLMPMNEASCKAEKGKSRQKHSTSSYAANKCEVKGHNKSFSRSRDSIQQSQQPP